MKIYYRVRAKVVVLPFHTAGGVPIEVNKLIDPMMGRFAKVDIMDYITHALRPFMEMHDEELIDWADRNGKSAMTTPKPAEPSFPAEPLPSREPRPEIEGSW